jgi:hypothetical protein
MNRYYYRITVLVSIIFSKKIGKVAGRHDVFVTFPAGVPRSSHIKSIQFMHTR